MDSFDPAKPFKSHMVVDAMVANYNQQHTGQISQDDVKILYKDPKLAEALFTTNVQAAFANGYVSIESLHKHPKLQEILSDKFVTNAMKDGVLSIDQLEKVSSHNMEEFNKRVTSGNLGEPAELGGLLGLNSEKSEALARSMAKTLLGLPTDGAEILLVPVPVTPQIQLPSPKSQVNTI